MSKKQSFRPNLQPIIGTSKAIKIKTASVQKSAVSGGVVVS